MTEAVGPRTTPVSAGPVEETFWRTLWNVVFTPRPAMSALGRDPHAGRKGVYVLAIVSVVYTLILAVAWIVALLATAVGVSTRTGRAGVAVTTAVIAVVYAVPVGLFIR